MQAASGCAWMILGVDAVMRAAPPALPPGIGLRPGGERPDLEPLVERSYRALHGAIAALAREGLHVAVDIGHHEARSRPLRLRPRCPARLDGRPVLVVGIRCPLEETMRRREGSAPHHARAAAAEPAPEPAPFRRWQEGVHDPGLRDPEVDTARSSPQDRAEAIRAALREAPTGARRTAALQ
jgi:chloramphenicol 3-O phosphotransferase